MNNGVLEGINSLVQATKAKARGYRDSLIMASNFSAIVDSREYPFTIGFVSVSSRTEYKMSVGFGTTISLKPISMRRRFLAVPTIQVMNALTPL